MKFGDSGVEIRSSCKGGSESSWSEWVRYQSGWVGRGEFHWPSDSLERSDGCRNVHGDKVVNGGIAPMKTIQIHSVVR